MADKKVYSIVINGVDEAAKRVDALNDALGMMNERVKALQGAKVEVTTNTVTTDTTDTSGAAKKTQELRTQDALLRQIASTETQIADSQREDYQRLLAQKDLLSQNVALQKERAAAERLAANEYANSMAGMKAQLADIKQVLNFKDLNDEGFDTLVQKANELNAKLKEVEQSYGQFGRNVGNYASAAEGFEKIRIAVGGTTREFASAREAYKTLSNELKTMAINGQQNTESFKELRSTVAELKSTIDDATKSSQAMDTMLDTMSSMVAIASTAQGIGTLFGMDNSKIQESIQKLLALQTALQGIETIRQQMQSGEFLGGIFSSANASIDEFSRKVFGIKESTAAAVEGEKELTTATKTMEATSKSAAKTQAATNATIATTGKVSRAAAVGVKVLSLALKTIGIGLIITAVTGLITLIEEWIDKESDLEKEQKRQAEVTEAGAKAYAKQRAELTQTVTAVNNFNGTKKQEQELVKQLNSQYGKTLGTYKTLAEWKDVLKNKTDALVESMRLEAEMNVLIGQYEKAYAEQLEAEEKLRNRTYDTSFFRSQQQDYEAAEKQVQDYSDKATAALEKVRKKAEEITVQQQKNGLGIFSPQNVSSSTKGAKDMKAAYETAQKTINDAVIALMQDGLRKQLVQLDKERSEKINAIRKNGVMVGEATLAVQRQYNAKEAELVRQHFADMEKEREKYDKAIQGMVESTRQRNLEASSTGIQNYQAQRSSMSYNVSSTSNAAANDKMIEAMMKNLDRLDQRIADTRAKFLTITGQTDIQKELTTQMNGVVAEISILQRHIDNLKEDIAYKEKFGLDTSAAEKQVQNLTKSLQDYKDRLEVIRQDLFDISGGDPSSLANGNMSLETALNVRLEAWEAYFQNVSNLAKMEAARYEQIESEKLDYDDKAMAELLKNYESMVGRQIGMSQSAVDRMRKMAEDASKDAEASQGTPDSGTKDWIADYFEDAASDAQTGSSKIVSILEKFKKKAEDMLAIGGNEQAYFNDLEKELQAYLQKREQEMQQAASRIAQIEKTEATQRSEAQNQEYENLKGIVQGYNEEINSELTNSYRQGKLTFSDYMRDMEGLQTAYENNITAIMQQAAANRMRVHQESLQKQKDSNASYMQSMINEFQNSFSTIENHLQNVANRTTKMGIVPVAKNAQDLNALNEATKSVMDKVLAKIREVQAAYRQGLLTDDAYQNIIGQLQSLYTQMQTSTQQHQQRMQENFNNWTQSINNYVQMFGSQLSQITQAMFSVQENWMQNHIDQLEEQISKQEEIMEKHAEYAEMHRDKINDIEGQLSSARGDRRQQLIDDLNAQMAAQRRELAEQKKAEREKKRLEQQKEKEEEQLAKQKKENARKQAIISGALAVANGLATSPFIPVGIAMGALAAALTAAQIAVINSTKYAKGGQLEGGVAEGPRHSQGGIKVLGGRAEIEGGEFITNRLTTSKNADVLEFINARKRRLNLSDFIEFYTEPKSMARSSVTVVRNRFASGGVMPTVSESTVNTDRLLDAVHEYAQRPIYVAVQEIEDVQSDMQKVRAMAGYEE